MKILELCDYSSGVCGVWQRVKQDAELLSKKNEVRIFSSNSVKGSTNFAPLQNKIGRINIRRFPFKKLGGESYLVWNFEREAIKYRPDIIIAHSYRHPHTTKALKIAKKIGAKVFLVTHAPFVENNSTRTFIEKNIVKFYDKFIRPKTINKFDKVIAITKWEIPYLLTIGCKKENIVYLPNGIPDSFFVKKTKKGKGVLFLGRISPVKNLEVVLEAIKNTNQKLTIIGPE